MPIVASDEKAFKFRGRESYQGLVFESAISMLQIFPVFPVLGRASLPFLQRCSLRVLGSLLHQHGVRTCMALHAARGSIAVVTSRTGSLIYSAGVRYPPLRPRCGVDTIDPYFAPLHVY